jgi:hypothetical protein
MPEITVHVDGMDAQQIAWELRRAAADSGADIEIEPNERVRAIDLPTIVESASIIVGGSAGAKVLYEVLRLFVQRSKSNEVQIEAGGTKVTIKGHSPEQEQELIREILTQSQQGRRGRKK